MVIVAIEVAMMVGLVLSGVMRKGDWRVDEMR